MTSSPPVLIVGGGLAGLCCARRLHQAGVPFELYEASDDVGGRVRTDKVEGFLLDRGFQVFLTAYPEARDVLDYDALGLQSFYPGALIRYRGRFRLLGDPLRKPADALPTLLNPAASLGDKLRVLTLRKSLSGRTLAELFSGQDRTTMDYLLAFGFSPAIIERFFRPFLGGVFLERELATTSRMFEFVFQMFAQGEATVPREGISAIPRQLAAFLPNDSIHRNCPVEAVEQHGVLLQSGERVEGACVVVATDLDQAGRWMPHQGERGWTGTHTLYFNAPEAPVRRPILVLNGEGRGLVNNLHVASQVNPACAPSGRALVSVTVLDGRTADDLETRVRSELKGWFGPEVNAWHHLRTYTIPHALPAQPVGRLDPPERDVRTQDGLYVSGDHLDQSSIQGAMMSGRRAAEAVLEDMNIRE